MKEDIAAIFVLFLIGFCGALSGYVIGKKIADNWYASHRPPVMYVISDDGKGVPNGYCPHWVKVDGQYVVAWSADCSDTWNWKEDK